MTRVALLGNPNVGKSSVFNALTGMNQHTGNWTGKTVETARGEYTYFDRRFCAIDLPGTYSLSAHSVEEEVSRDYIYKDKPDIVIVVCNPAHLERSLCLLLQVLELTNNVILCVNMIDEAREKGIKIDKEGLKRELNIPVVFTSAKKKEGIDELKKAIFEFKQKGTQKRIIFSEDTEQFLLETEKVFEINLPEDKKRWLSLQLIENGEKAFDLAFSNEDDKKTARSILKELNCERYVQAVRSAYLKEAKRVCDVCVTNGEAGYDCKDMRLDKIFTGRWTAAPIMLLLIGVCLWITVFGANYISDFLFNAFGYMRQHLIDVLDFLRVPEFFKGFFVDGLYGVTTWVVSVMLPPMAIFFPLFALLEDGGFLPRIAFNLDGHFKKCGTCGKQALTCALGIGCNAVGVTGCRIISSPKERLIAILTNSFMPCNGRFPAMIAIISMFMIGGATGGVKGAIVAAVLILVIIIGLFMTFFCSYLLSKTLLKGMASAFIMEMPPYRRPQFLKTIYRALKDKALKVLWRAVVVALPAGGVIWIIANIKVGGVSLLLQAANWINPFAVLFGLDGAILLAFILGAPANEIVVPILLMIYMSTGAMMPFENLSVLKEVLVNNGWTISTAVCMVLFSLMHWPCSTTLMTIKKETGSFKWTVVAAIIPALCGFAVCFVVNVVLKLFCM